MSEKINVSEIVIDGTTYVPKSAASKELKGDEVIIRTYSAGVHIGIIESREGQEIVLNNARRLWKWAGAFTLNAVATCGVDRSNSRISTPVKKITLLDCIEIIPVSEGVDLSTTE